MPAWFPFVLRTLRPSVPSFTPTSPNMASAAASFYISCYSLSAAENQQHASLTHGESDSSSQPSPVDGEVLVAPRGGRHGDRGASFLVSGSEVVAFFASRPIACLRARPPCPRMVFSCSPLPSRSLCGSPCPFCLLSCVLAALGGFAPVALPGLGPLGLFFARSWAPPSEADS